MSRVRETLYREEKRNPWLDNVACLMVIAMVLLHLVSGMQEESEHVDRFNKFFYIFTMPTLTFLAGYWMKDAIKNRQYGHFLGRLVLPYVLFSVVLAVVYSKVGRGYPAGVFNLLYPLYALWFLLALAVYAFLTPSIAKCKWALPISLGVTLLIGVGTSYDYISFSQGIAYYPYFLLGYLLTKEKLESFKKTRYWILGLLFLVALAVFVYVFHEGIYISTMNMEKPYAEYPGDLPAITAFFYRVIFLLVSILAIFAWLAVVPKKKHFFTYVGSRWMYVYLLHTIVIVVLRYLDKQYAFLELVDESWEYLLYALAGILLCFLLASKPVRWATRPIIEPKMDFTFMSKPPVVKEDACQELQQEVETLNAKLDALERELATWEESEAESKPKEEE